MTTRKTASNWLIQQGKNIAIPFYASKFYSPKQSYNRQAVWWFKIPLKKLEESKYIQLLCLPANGQGSIQYFKVPSSFFLSQIKSFVKLAPAHISIYISADAPTLYRETRGNGSLGFADFWEE